MLFSLTNNVAVYRPQKPEKAVGHYSNWGPSWFYALAAGSDPMNGANCGHCYTNGAGGDGEFNIPLTGDGASALTGEGQGQNDSKNFTISEIEVFLF